MLSTSLRIGLLKFTTAVCEFFCMSVYLPRASRDKRDSFVSTASMQFFFFIGQETMKRVAISSTYLQSFCFQATTLPISTPAPIISGELV